MFQHTLKFSDLSGSAQETPFRSRVIDILRALRPLRSLRFDSPLTVDLKTKKARACASVSLPATCGELFQGTLDGVTCLVSCPIDRYSAAQVALHDAPGWDMPTGVPKAVTALFAGLDYLGKSSPGGKLNILSDLPRGRGYASSTADVSATLYALAEATGEPLEHSEVARLAVGVEPSDSIMFPGLALFDHRDGSFHRCLSPAPPLSVIVLDPGGEVDTLGFNRTDCRAKLRKLAPRHQEAFDLLAQGLADKNWPAFGAGVTLSATTHELILSNPLLEKAQALAREVGAVGVCRAHSGTILGLLVDPAQVDIQAATHFVNRALADRVTVALHRLAGGGPRYTEREYQE